MSEERKKPAPWSWGKVAIVALAIYVASFVGLVGLDARLMTPGQSDALRFIYAPIIWSVKQIADTP